MTKKLLSLCLALVMLLSVSLSLAEAAPVTVKDFGDTEVALKAPASAIVAVMPGDCEILFALGVGDKVVGRGAYCDYPAEGVANIPVVQSGFDLNVEQIVALKPDLVILTKMAHTPEMSEALKNAQIPVYLSDAQTMEGTYRLINDLGVLTGRKDEAVALVKSMQDRLQAVADKAKDFAEVSAYYEVSPLQFGLWASGANTFMDELGQLVKFKNIFADGEGWAQVSEEQVLTRAPQVILTTAMYMGEGDKPEEEIVKRAGWQDVPAVKDGRVYNVDTNVFSRPGPRLAEAAEALLALAETK